MSVVRRAASWPLAIPVAVGLILVLNTIGIVIALVGEFPKEFGGAGDPDNVLGEAPFQGTLLSAPLPPILVLIGMAWLALRPNWLAVVGLLGVTIICVVMTIGYLGEPLHPKASDPPVAFIVTWKVIGISVMATTIGLCLARLYRRLREASAAG